MITWLESRDAPPDRLDLARQIDAEWLLTGAKYQPKERRLAPHHVPVEHVDRRGPHGNQNLVVGRRRLVDVFDVENVGRAEVPIYNCLHSQR